MWSSVRLIEAFGDTVRSGMTHRPDRSLKRTGRERGGSGPRD